jgi:HEAT repeat protein
MRIWALWGALAVSMPLTWGMARAEKTKPRLVAAPPPAAPSLATPERLQALEGNDESAAIDAARALSQAPATDLDAVGGLVTALGHGAAPKVSAAMLRALAGKSDARTVAMLERYAQHRTAAVREAALDALAALPAGDKRALSPLLAALGDSDAEVRAHAAQCIGARRESGAEERLVKLLEHRDPASASALAAIGTPQLAHRLSEMLGSVPDPILCSALGEMLKRADFGPEPIRVEVVRTLAKVPGADSTTVLLEYVAASERDKNRPSRLEAQKIVDERSRQ